MVLLELWRVAMNYKTVVVVVVFSVSIALELIPPSVDEHRALHDHEEGHVVDPLPVPLRGFVTGSFFR